MNGLTHWVVTYWTPDKRRGKAVFGTKPEAEAFAVVVRGDVSDKPLQVKYGTHGCQWRRAAWENAA